MGCIRHFIANDHEYKFEEHPVGDVTKGFDIRKYSIKKKKLFIKNRLIDVVVVRYNFQNRSQPVHGSFTIFAVEFSPSKPQTIQLCCLLG